MSTFQTIMAAAAEGTRRSSDRLPWNYASPNLRLVLLLDPTWDGVNVEVRDGDAVGHEGLDSVHAVGQDAIEVNQFLE